LSEEAFKDELAIAAVDDKEDPLSIHREVKMEEVKVDGDAEMLEKGSVCESTYHTPAQNCDNGTESSENVNGTNKMVTENAPDKNDTKEKVEDGKSTLFTSEVFKIEVQGLPKYFGVGEAKKIFNKKLDLKTHKIKPCGPKANYMFINFRNEEDREHAIRVLDGYVIKGSKLKAFKSKAAKDPYRKAREEEAKEVTPDPRSTVEKLQGAMCPYVNLSYEEQLAKKQLEVLTIVKRMGTEIGFSNQSIYKSWVTQKCKTSSNGSCIAPVDEIILSPRINGYRNKCEFSIGFTNPASKEEDTVETEEKENTKEEECEKMEEEVKEKENAETIAEDNTVLEDKIPKKEVGVGFRLASYKAGSVEVVSLSSLKDPSAALPQISDKMITVTKMLEILVKASGIAPYNSIDRTGNWRHVLVRTSEAGQVMAVVVVDPQGLENSSKMQIKSDLTSFFTDGAGSLCGITSLFVQFSPARKSQNEADPAPILLSGDPCIQETLFKLNFNISPQAFFQVNTKAAEVLYGTVGDMAGLKPTTTLVDICCGTGTIGLCLADRVHQVIGVELIAEAVRDARKNASSNGIENVSFFAGRAEDVLSGILRGIDSKEIVAVVDPPRAGLHPKALAAIRNCLAIRKLVYVACDAKLAMKNFVQLSQPASKNSAGDPFLPMKVVPVDLFPHGKQFELVVLFERVPFDDLINVETEETKAGENVLNEIMGDLMD